MTLFPLSEYWSFYGLFLLFVFGMLALDLGVFHRHAHRVTCKEALTWTLVWIGLALLFNYGFYHYVLWKLPHVDRLMTIPGFDPAHAAKQTALEFLTGYLVEKSLSVDNIFVFVVVFRFFAVPSEYQHRILFFGILGALVFRILFIALGSILIEYKVVTVIFGVSLILTGIKLLLAPEKPMDPEANPVIKLLRRLLPITSACEGQKFFTLKNNILHGTPLLVALVFIEITDIIFAVDSVPAIFAITKEPFIVFTSNVFAILGLRSMYFLLADIMDKFHFLRYGLAVVLLFVGLKMVWLNDAFGGKFPTIWSLGIIASTITISIILSLLITKKHPPTTT